MNKARFKALLLLKPKFQIIFSCIITTLALVITWLILGENSPYHEYFIWHVGIPNLWGMTTIIPFIISAIISGNPHAPSLIIGIIVLIVQWLLIGFLLSIPISKILINLRKR